MVELRPQNTTLTGDLPHDRPSATRPHRVYVATTNHCNRACPWCSTCSSPRGDTWLGIPEYLAALPAQGEFEVQLEGGEPTLHPRFFELVDLARPYRRAGYPLSRIPPGTIEARAAILERVGTPQNRD